MTLERYLENRRTGEVLIATVMVLVSLFANVGVVWIEYARGGGDWPRWMPWVLEVTSHIGLAVIIPLIVWFDRRFPIRADTWRVSVLAHALFSVVASLVHVIVMYIGRVLAFRVFSPDHPYQWDEWTREFGYEYLKDFRTYMLILAMIYLYRFIILRLQGEAGFVADDDDEDRPAISDRFLVKKFGREFLVRVSDIEWIESAGNYVNLHVRGRVYPLRDTMTNISEKLATQGFQRVHRSAIVNLDQVAEIVAFDTGDGEARLRTEATVPVSRRFRKELRERLG
ncbi:MAG: LytTR family DNA-binding domain-containing protein [Woeseiaceae bacterium]|nr:LytTR family DNA-binding domain-containing protein [Woeseiaceae bacterium]